jgi:hypothetical protein
LTSQYGTVSISSLPIVSVDGVLRTASEASTTAPHLNPLPAETFEQSDIFAKIERLAELHQKGITPQEFAAKRNELLSRL